MRLFRPLSALLAGLALLSAGCLDFEKQSVVLSFNTDRDEIDALFLYEGLHVGGNGKPADIQKAKETLEKFFAHGTGFYLGHPMFEVHLEKKKEEPGKVENPREKRFQQLVLDHVKMGDRAFFVGKNETLSGTQVIHLRLASKFVDGVNELISEEILENAEKKLTDASKRKGGEDEVESLKLQQKAARDKLKWIKLEPGRLSVQIVGTQKYFENMKKELVEEVGLGRIRHLIDPPAPVPGQPPQPKKMPAEIVEEIRDRLKTFDQNAKFLSEVPLSFEFRKERLILSLGLGDGEPIRAYSPHQNPKPGLPGPVLEHARTLKVTMLKDATPESVAADFLKKYAPKK